jgi:hypothetical protein
MCGWLFTLNSLLVEQMEPLRKAICSLPTLRRMISDEISESFAETLNWKFRSLLIARVDNSLRLIVGI